MKITTLAQDRRIEQINIAIANMVRDENGSLIDGEKYAALCTELNELNEGVDYDEIPLFNEE